MLAAPALALSPLVGDTGVLILHQALARLPRDHLSRSAIASLQHPFHDTFRVVRLLRAATGSVEVEDTATRQPLLAVRLELAVPSGFGGASDRQGDH